MSGLQSEHTLIGEGVARMQKRDESTTRERERGEMQKSIKLSRGSLLLP